MDYFTLLLYVYLSLTYHHDHHHHLPAQLLYPKHQMPAISKAGANVLHTVITRIVLLGKAEQCTEYNSYN